MLEKVFYTSVLVTDQDRALDFYTNVLGMEKRVENPTPDGPRFLAVPPARYFPDYAPVLPGTVCAELGLPHPGDALLYCLLTVPRGDVGAATVNLRAPVVVNPLAGLGRQVVLADGAHPIRRPLRR